MARFIPLPHPLILRIYKLLSHTLHRFSNDIQLKYCSFLVSIKAIEIFRYSTYNFICLFF